MVTVSPASTMFVFPPEPASATMDLTSSTIASLEMVNVSVLSAVSVPSRFETAVTAMSSVPDAFDGAVTSMMTPNCSPEANVGVSLNGVALSATPSMFASG